MISDGIKITEIHVLLEKQYLSLCKKNLKDQTKNESEKQNLD